MPEKIIPLANGVEELFVKTDRFSTTLVSFNFYLPLDRERVADYALLPFVLTTCGKNYPDFSKLNFTLSKLYGANLFASAEKVGDLTLLKMGISVIDDRFSLDGESIIKEATGMLLDLIFNPKAENGVFCADDLEREKRKAVEHIKGEMSDKRAYASGRLIEEMFSEEVYGTPKCGTVEQVEAITGEGLFAAWETMLKSAYLRVIIVSGKKPEGITENICERFSSVIRENITDCRATMPSRRRTDVKRITERMDIAQGKLCMGFSTGLSGDDKDCAALTVMADIFGGGPYSRLFGNVREKMSLCYYCSARLTKVKGFLTVESGVESENAEKAEKEILNQLSIIGRGEFTDEEFNSSIRGITDSLKTCLDSQSTIDNWYGLKISGKEAYTPDDLAEFVGGVTREEVARLARNISLNTVYKLLPKEDVQ